MAARPKPITEPEPTETPEMPTPDVPAAETEEDNRPPIVKLFERIGLTRGASISHVHMTSGHIHHGPIEIIDVKACDTGYGLEVMLEVREPGVKGPAMQVRWANVEAFRPV